VNTTIRTVVAAVATAAFAFSAPVSAQQKIKIGFISTFSGPQGVMGQYMKESVELAIEHLGGKVGGLPVEMFYGDDQLKPDVGVQVAEEMLKKNQVDFVSGIIWSNVMMAVVPVVTGANKIMVGTNAGASPLAGKDCNKLYFSTSWNNDQTPEAMGKFLTDQGVNDLYVMAPNYQAGKDMVAGLKRYYKGRIVEEVYTKLGQQDYQAEISQLQAKGPKAVFAFYPGGMGIQFIKQYDQAGLRGKLPLYTVYTVDEISIPAVKDALLEPGPEKRGEPEVRRRLQEEVRQAAGVLRRAELRRHHADGLGGARGQGQPERHRRHGEGDGEGRLPLAARAVHLQHQSPSDPELLPAQDREAGERRHRDAHPEDDLREAQGFVLPRLQDEVVELLGR
jgi:ABC-type branched-subunit amino acid transport system substrate-binding protein